MNNDTINKKKMCQVFKHRARACCGIRNGAGCRKETRQLQDRCWRRGGALWGAVGHRIAPAINDMLSPAARSEKSNTPHQSAPMDRKSESWVDVSERHCLHGPLVCNEINKSFEVAGEVAKGPGNQGKVGAVRPKLLRESYSYFESVEYFGIIQMHCP